VETTLDGIGLDVLINNAGVMPYTSGGISKIYVLLCLAGCRLIIRALLRLNLREVFKANATSVKNTIQAFLALLKQIEMKKVINV
jgi:NAD(P)-dependent dehydrogenase (short-subunit alcohol dehydrogenase family)